MVAMTRNHPIQKKLTTLLTVTHMCSMNQHSQYVYANCFCDLFWANKKAEMSVKQQTRDLTDN